MENAPGETIEQALSPPYPAIQLIRWGVLQIQIVVAEAIMVLRSLRSMPPLVVANDACRQVYRMYYIYGRNRFAFMLCIVPALCVLTLLGELGFPLVLYSPSFLTQLQFRRYLLVVDYYEGPSSRSHGTNQHQTGVHPFQRLLPYQPVVSSCESR